MKTVQENFFDALCAVPDSLAAAIKDGLAGDLTSFTPDDAKLFAVLRSAGLTAEQQAALVGLVQSTCLTAVASVLAEVDQRSAMDGDPDEELKLVDVEGNHLSSDLYGDFWRHTGV